MGETQETIATDSLAAINDDGSMTKLVIGPMIGLAIVVAVLIVLRTLQKSKERREMEASLKE